MQSAVHPKAWHEDLPRPWTYGLAPITQSQPWFDVYALSGSDYAIYEPGHFQEVISYLICGRDRALLFDTGMGIGNMQVLVGELTDLPLVVVNSHTHFDHVGCNHRFEQVHVLDHPVAIARLQKGQPRALPQEEAGEYAFARPLPAGIVPTELQILPCTPISIKEGHVFDLGGRTLRVLATPGHSPDSIMLLDQQNGILLTGDTLYPATMYAHLSSGDGMTSSFAVYAATMEALPQRVGTLNHLYCSHNEPVCPPAMLQEAAHAFEMIRKDQVPYAVDENGLRKYQFNGFAIVTQNPPLKACTE